MSHGYSSTLSRFRFEQARRVPGDPSPIPSLADLGTFLANHLPRTAAIDFFVVPAGTGFRRRPQEIRRVGAWWHSDALEPGVAVALESGKT